jgi:para-nitrobenzyl esterase
MNDGNDLLIHDSSRINRRDFARAVSTTVAGVAAAALWPSGSLGAEEVAPLAQTTAGKVCGATEVGGVHVFKGVPYGASTAAMNRFRQAQRPEPWIGILDALTWVRDNVVNFGGDPGNVTICGESGGGRKIANLLAMPAAKGLFHRAIIESGPSIHVQPRDRATAMAIELMKEVGLKPTEIEELHDIPVEQLVKAYDDIDNRLDEQGESRLKGGLEHHGFIPTAGFGSLPEYAFEPVAPEVSANVPPIIGTNHHEWALQFRPDKQIYDRTLTESQLSDRRNVLAGRGGPRVMETYARLYPNTRPAVRFILLATARIYRQDSIALAERKAYQKKAPVYMYRFDWESQRDVKMLAHHGIEVPFVFDNTSRGDQGGQGPKAAALADKISDAWIAFSRTGNSNVPRLPHWAAYDPQSRATMLFNDECRAENDPDSAERHLWATT